MAGLELLSNQGYQVDRRKAGELRKIQARIGVFTEAAFIKQGAGVLILTLSCLFMLYYIYICCSKANTLHDRTVVNDQYSMATFSTGDRKRRPHGDRTSTEMSLHMKQTFEAAILTPLYPRSQIHIYVQTINDDTSPVLVVMAPTCRVRYWS
ncbi:exosome complex component RRP41-like [Anomaloglossus baeobatrachus]